MKKVALFFGSTTGTCEEIAYKIAKQLNLSKSDVYNVTDLSADKVAEYEVLLLGTSTWGDGELQDDWYDGIEVLKGVDLADKTVALFGCGDSESYSDTFCDGIGLLYKDLKASGCTFIGNKVPTDSYEFASSLAVDNGAFVGLAIDDLNQSDLTDARIEDWVNELKREIG
ncbi:MAG: flavodoxin [Bacteroides graminisolvens]|nr:flavodoxin [Bacteroides sp.]